VATHDVADDRRHLASRLYGDASYGVFDAMVDMVAVAERELTAVAWKGRTEGVWVGGSLGRCEILPNSDVDVFVLREGIGRVADVSIAGFDKVDLAQLTTSHAELLLQSTLVDANRIVDGRPLCDSAIAERIRSAVRRCNTHDRQFANLVAEYGYFHYFDFPLKRTALGPNLKYSAGSARETLFFDFVHRYVTGEIPADRSSRPELEAALMTAENTLARRAPRRSVELISVVKCAAISAYDSTGDVRMKHISRTALSMIHDMCRPRMAALGLGYLDDFATTYSDARQEITTTIATLVATVIASHPCADAFRAVAQAPVADMAAMGVGIAAELPEWRRSLLTHAAWQLVIAQPGPELVHALAHEFMGRPLADVWGGLMAIACCPTADDETLSRLVTWLSEHETGGYLSKLVRRNPAASPATRAMASAVHLSREVLREFT
jgi:hypothetical protein